VHSFLFFPAPGQAYTDGIAFCAILFWVWPALAMVVICITFAAAFNRLKVYTAYHFLENRFDLKTHARLHRRCSCWQRALSTGISIYAPPLFFSFFAFGWDIFWQIL
jgi:uncharacterized sodium:solute symporter family permease YidK